MTALGGRVAEELVYGEGQVTTGAAGDLEMVATIARKMVASFGFNSELGAADWAASKASAPDIDREVRALVVRLYERTRSLLEGQRATIRRVADALYERETLDQTELEALVHN